MSERIKRQGAPGIKWGENISYGQDNGKSVITALLVDDGVADRGHRKNLFTDAYGATGIFTGPHKQYR